LINPRFKEGRESELWRSSRTALPANQGDMQPIIDRKIIGLMKGCFLDMSYLSNPNEKLVFYPETHLLIVDSGFLGLLKCVDDKTCRILLSPKNYESQNITLYEQ
ncbi:MAG: hypothetical protein SV375_04395, partial [Thermodesulfobacteriota bacterium]|nr:hypothetical protein [Thermodesulfobacteriota bacterium]